MSAKSSKQGLSIGVALFVWAGLLAIGAAYGVRLGYGGRHFVFAMGVAAVLLAVEIFLAVPAVQQRCAALASGGGTVVAPLVPLGAYLIYALFVSGAWKAIFLGAAYVLIPCFLAARARGKAAGTWEDYLALLTFWQPVQWRWHGSPWLYRLWPYPAPLTHTLATLLALSTGVVAFVLLRELDGIGYAVTWRRGFLRTVALNFLIFSAIAIPLGESIGFIHYAPSASRLHDLPVAAAGIFFFTAWPEEFLFRGLLQNLLGKTMKSQWGGLLLASVIFGFSHIHHAPFPNWRYVLLATIAGIFYGLTWKKTKTIFASALVHAAVDILWHLLFI